jgi:hypothetical protein
MARNPARLGNRRGGHLLRRKIGRLKRHPAEPKQARRFTPGGFFLMANHFFLAAGEGALRRWIVGAFC